MILVTVGMHTDGFMRLVVEMDRIAFETDEEVVMQIGHTPYSPRAARWFTFTSQKELDELASRARVVVSHAGAGSILSFLSCGKPLIVMPRLAKYGEHMDDHQLELAEALARNGMLLMANEASDLLPQLRQAESLRPPAPNPDGLVSAVRRAVLGLPQAAR